MKVKRYSNAQKIHSLNEVAAGADLVTVCHRLGIEVDTFYRWQEALAGRPARSPGPSELREENRRLKRLAADLLKEIEALRRMLRR